MLLSKRATEILLHLRDDPDPDLVCCKGVWWCGEEKTHGKIAKQLLQFVLISEDQYSSEDVRRYHINEWGRRVLNDPSFLQEIVSILFKNIKICETQPKLKLPS